VAWRRDGRPLVVRVSAGELRIRGQAAQTLSVTYTLFACQSSVFRTGDTVRLQRNGLVPVVVRPGNIRPLRLVVVLRNAAGRRVERRFDLVTGVAQPCP
jgi:hypothetical protein